MSELKVGMKLFHRNALGTVRECELIKIYAENSDEKIEIKLSKKIKIPRKNEKVDIFHLSTKAIGQYLFFEKEDTLLSTRKLANMPNYIEYGNETLCQSVKAQEEERIRLEYEQKKRENFRLIAQEGRRREIQNITDLLEERNIKYLVYFTRIENLNSILKNGIVPEKYHLQKGICAVSNNCQKKYDFQYTGNGYSIEFPNYRLLNRLREDGNPNDSYVILRLDAKSVLTDTIYKHIYCEDNALNNSAKYSKVNRNNPARGIFYADGDLKKLFLQRYFKEASVFEGEYQEEKDINRDDLDIPDNYTTNPQAEIVIGDIVKPKYIEEVVFENGSDKQLWLEENYEFQNLPVDFIVDERLFGPRSDYLFWKKSTLEYVPDISEAELLSILNSSNLPL